MIVILRNNIKYNRRYIVREALRYAMDRYGPCKSRSLAGARLFLYILVYMYRTYGRPCKYFVKYDSVQCMRTHGVAQYDNLRIIDCKPRRSYAT